MIRSRSRALLLLALWLSLAACARRDRSAPLPGDSVAADGAVSLATPQLATNVSAPAPAVAHEPLSAIEKRIFPAELVMEHQADIGLTPAQRDAITRELDASQTALVKLQWELQAEKDKLVAILDASKVDEAASQQAAAALMKRENAIKAAHLAMLVRIKNVLSAEQQSKLQAARDACPGAGASP